MGSLGEPRYPPYHVKLLESWEAHFQDHETLVKSSRLISLQDRFSRSLISLGLTEKGDSSLQLSLWGVRRWGKWAVYNPSFHKLPILLGWGFAHVVFFSEKSICSSHVIPLSFFWWKCRLLCEIFLRGKWTNTNQHNYLGCSGPESIWSIWGDLECLGKWHATLPSIGWPGLKSSAGT